MIFEGLIQYLSTQDLVFTFMVCSCIALAAHLVGDFFFQSEEMGKKKAVSKKVLTGHVVIYTMVLILCTSFFYGAINGAAHWVTDYFTSKQKRSAYENGENKKFIIWLGVDQFIHSITLIITLYIMFF